MTSLAAMHDWLRDLDPARLSRPELYGLIADLERLRSRVDERLLTAKASIDALADTGADAATVGRAMGRRSMRQAKHDQSVARTLTELPALADSLAEGRVNVEHASIISRATSEVDLDVAAELVPMAESLPADLFARKAREFVGRHTDQAAARERHERQRRRRAGWHTVHGDGTVEIHARSTRRPVSRCWPPGTAAPTRCGVTTAAGADLPTMSAPRSSAALMRSPPSSPKSRPGRRRRNRSIRSTSSGTSVRDRSPGSTAIRFPTT